LEIPDGKEFNSLVSQGVKAFQQCGRQLLAHRDRTVSSGMLYILSEKEYFEEIKLQKRSVPVILVERKKEKRLI
jgi:hypothetical protein